MAEGDLILFNAAKLGLLNGTHDLDTHVIKCAIINNTLTPVATASNPKLADYTQVSSAGTYTAGGTTLTIALSESAGIVTFDATNNLSWALDGSNGTDAYWALVYNDTNASDAAIGYIDLGGPVNMVTTTLAITWHPNGLFTLQVL